MASKKPRKPPQLRLPGARVAVSPYKRKASVKAHSRKAPKRKK